MSSGHHDVEKVARRPRDSIYPVIPFKDALKIVMDHTPVLQPEVVDINGKCGERERERERERESERERERQTDRQRYIGKYKLDRLDRLDVFKMMLDYCSFERVIRENNIRGRPRGARGGEQG